MKTLFLETPYFTISREMVTNGIKRAMDITIALVALVLASPFMIAAALSIRFSDPGPIIFRQIRVGKDKKLFHIYKFRTMYTDAEERKAELMARSDREGMFKMKDDVRIFPAGRVLRKFSIDELPQLFNILQGTMSAVGPRPCLPSEVKTFGFTTRFNVKPGLTGLASIRGRADLTMGAMLSYDALYVSDISLWNDIKILAGTIPAVLSAAGAY